MQPIDCYNDTADRAWRLLALRDGLLNIRQRRVRAPWREKFNRLMGWGVNQEIERVDSHDAILILREDSELNADDFTAESLDDLLRSSLVLGVSALDRYVHERVTKSIVAALRKGQLSATQKKFSIPAYLAVHAVQNLASARSRNKRVRPNNEIRNQIQTLLHRRPLQSWEEIEEAFALIGISGFTGAVQAQYRVGDIKPIREQLGKIVHRRNSIVHEGDIVLHKKGGNLRHTGIERLFVVESLNFLDDFVGHLAKI